MVDRGTSHPNVNAQRVVKQLTLARRIERLSLGKKSIEEQLPAIISSLHRKGVILTDAVLTEAQRRIHESHDRTIGRRRPQIAARANARADFIIELLKQEALTPS